ncbi:MAG TPA: glycosyltransferase family 2 protein [Acidiphilium sp.]|nr:glycosyltransferase family 2 protein [Acidiphilium sp.]
MTPRIAVVIPTLNEADSIARVVAEVRSDLVGDIVVADGCSTDDTAARAEAAGARVLSVGRGYGRACAAGATAADVSCDIIVFLDGDGADRADLLGLLAAPILEGTHDFVLASRTRGQRESGSMLWHQVLAGRVAGLITGARYRVPYSDMCAFRAIRRESLIRLGLRETHYGWNIEMQMRAAGAGLRILEIPMPYRCRTSGHSKVAGSLPGTMRATIHIIRTVGRLFWNG